MEKEELKNLDLSKVEKGLIDSIAQTIGEIPTMSAEDLAATFTKGYFAGLRNEGKAPEEVIRRLEIAVESRQKEW
jgi:hypothetical protein